MLKANIEKIILAIILIGVFSFSKSALALNENLALKEIGESCKNNNECASGDCEESSKPGSPSFCVCNKNSDCNVYGGNNWVCEDKDEYLTFGLHYCKKNGAVAGDISSPIPMQLDKYYCLGSINNGPLSCEPVPSKGRCDDFPNKFYLPNSFTAVGLNSGGTEKNTCETKKNQQNSSSNFFCRYNGVCLSNYTDKNFCPNNYTGTKYTTLQDCQNSKPEAQSCNSTSDCSDKLQYCVAGKCYYSLELINAGFGSCDVVGKDCEINSYKGVCLSNGNNKYCALPTNSTPNISKTSNTCVGDNKEFCYATDKSCSIDTDCAFLTFSGACYQKKCWYTKEVMEQYNKQNSGFASDLKIIKPLLEIRIPGLTFSDVSNTLYTDQDTGASFITIPYIGEYIANAYKFAIALASIIAVVMIIVEGVKIVVLGGEQTANGYKRIGQIIIGMTITWTSYTILYIVNPDLVSFKALRIQYTEPEEYVFDPITLTDEDFNDSGSGGPYEFKYFTECPVQLTNQPVFNSTKPTKPGDIRQNIPRRVEFHEKMIAENKITGNIQERIIKAVEAATQCKIQYENCGVGSTNMYALAAKRGSKSDLCLKNANAGKSFSSARGDGFCNFLGNSFGNIKKTMVHNVWNTQTSYGKVSTMMRGFYCGSKSKCSSIGWKEDCIADKSAASKRLKEILNKTGKWSESWVDDLKPGDYYMIVNWNPSCGSTHSAMFLGWKDKAARSAYVEMADAANFLRIGTKNFNGDDVVVLITRPKD